MNLHDYVTSEYGRAIRLAHVLKLPPSLISQWAAAPDNRLRRRVPLQHRPRIERATAGEVPCEDLGGDVVWLRVPDKRWPWHRRGRPAVDITKVVR